MRACDTRAELPGNHTNRRRPFPNRTVTARGAPAGGTTGRGHHRPGSHGRETPSTGRCVRITKRIRRWCRERVGLLRRRRGSACCLRRVEIAMACARRRGVENAIACARRRRRDRVCPLPRRRDRDGVCVPARTQHSSAIWARRITQIRDVESRTLVHCRKAPAPQDVCVHGVRD